MWQNQITSHKDTQTSNPFRRNDIGVNAKEAVALKPGDVNYGKPVAGSRTAERAAQATEWVEREIEKLLVVIREIGENQMNGKVTVTFGKLFVAYQNISDTLVGIMMRAKKRNLIIYPG